MPSMEKFLVYIPVHSDFLQGIEQAQILRSEFKSIQHLGKYLNLELIIVTSVNAYDPTQNEILKAESIFNEVIYYGKHLLADINIAQGFTYALRKHSDYLWVLSTNDKLIHGSLELILDSIVTDQSIDLIAINGSGLNSIFEESGIINPPRTKFSYGVISGVIYRQSKFEKYFNVAPFLAWTGWSHLAVLESAFKNLGRLKVRTIPHTSIYTQNERELRELKDVYGHGFFGMLIIGFLMEKSHKTARKYLRSYVFRNFYLIHLFSRDWNREFGLVVNENYLSWNQSIAESILKSKVPFTYTIYKVFESMPFENFQKNKVLNFFRVKIKDKFQK
jgi:hypothetical protein